MRFRPISPLLISVALGACAVADSTQPSVPADETFAPALEVDLATMTQPLENLYYKDIVVGTGTPAASIGRTIVVYYAGYLTDGTKFDGNFGGDSLRIPLKEGNGGVITGWVYGIAGMKPGGTRKLVIGSQYAYGSRGRGPIPPHATLVFDVELKRVE